MAWFDRPVPLIVYFACGILLLSSQADQVSAQFKFLIKPRMFYAIRLGARFNINCTTNDLSANTTLYYRPSRNKPWQQLLPNNERLVQSGDVYTVLDFGLSDSGQYQCRARNDQGYTIKWPEFLSNVIPNKNLVPEVRVIPEYAVVLTAGQSYNITCSSVSRVALQWFKRFTDGTESVVPSNKVALEKNTKNTKLVLMFKDAQRSDAGTYRCLMTYQGKTNFKYSTLTVYEHEMPKILSFTRTPLLVKESNQTILHCSGYGHPRPDISWYKNGKQITVPGCRIHDLNPTCMNKKYKLRTKAVTKHTTVNSSLTIFNSIYPDDEGSYTCKAINTQGRINATMFVNVQVQPVIVEKKDPFFQVNNKPSVVFCIIKKSNPPASFTWEFQPCIAGPSACVPQKNWSPLPSTHSVEPASGVATNRSQVQIPKEQEAAFYRCTATNKYGTDQLEVAFRRIDEGRKLVEIKSPQRPPVLTAPAPITIVCLTLSQGALFGGVDWFRDEVLLSSLSDPRINITNVPIEVDITYTNVVLTIVNTTSNDSGLYTCDARFLRPKSIFNDTIMVVVEDRVGPNITGLVSQEVREKIPGYVELLCETTTANPKAKITWYKQKEGRWRNLEKKISRHFTKTEVCENRNQGFYIFNDVDSRLVICHPTHSKHTGWYQCTAENSEGKHEKQARLNILAPPRIVNGRKEVQVALGTPVNETCSATGNPLPDVVWTRTNDPNGEVLSRGEGRALLVVKNVQEEDLGNYTCNATNIIKSAIVVFTIKEDREPTMLGLKDGMTTEVLVGIISGCVAFVLIVVIICLILYRRQKKQIDEYKELYFLRTGNSDYKIDPDRSLLDQCNNLPYDLDWEFPEERLILGKPLGSGAFGQVLKAEAIGMPAFKPRDKTPDGLKRRSKLRRSMRESRKKNEYSSMRTAKQTVAVKCLKEGASASDYKDLASELKILIHLGEHKNIVNVLGACTRGRRLMVIIEYAPHGDLLSFLRGKRDIFDPKWLKTSNNPEQEFTLVDLGMTAYQISRGMEFLASRKCVHRDLAARNVLVGQNYVMKISDFGLARDIYQDDLYVKTTSGLLPVKWMALESLFDRVYTEKSDVWSFGVMLWEIFTLGGTPYPGLPTEQLLDYLSEGSRMNQPQNCPLEMYAIMRDCWIEGPDQRPNFVAIAERLGKILEKNVTKDNPYIQLEVDENSGTTDYYLNPCDSDMRSRKLTADGYEEALPTPSALPGNYNSPLPTIPSESSPESPGFETPNSPLPSIPPTYEEAIQKPRSNPEYRNISESSNESGIEVGDKGKDREVEENEPLLEQLGYEIPTFSPAKKAKKGKREIESLV